MASLFNSFLDGIDTFLAWLSTSLKQTTESYCDLETADSPTVIVAHDGSLISLIKISGVTQLIGNSEFERLHEGLTLSLQTALSRAGHALQVLFHYDRDVVTDLINDTLAPGQQTSERLGLNLSDLFKERVSFLSKHCAYESVYFVLWTRPLSLTTEQYQRSTKDKLKFIRDKKVPPFQITQNAIAAIPDLRDTHDAFVRSVIHDLSTLNIAASLLEVHDAVHAIRSVADPIFTDKNWRPALPGDKILPKEYDRSRNTISDVLWPSLARQVLPRDAENLDLRTVRLGDQIYSCIFIDLLPKEIKSFNALLQRTLAARIPWRISFFIESDGLRTIKLKSVLASVLSFSSAQNRLLSDANNLLQYIAINTDDAVVRLRVAACTWAPEGQLPLLRTRAAELAKAIEGWGSCDVSEVSGDPFGGLASTLLGMSAQSVATPTIVPFSQVVYMLPITRPASPWKTGAQLFRSPDGKPWPFQPGSSEQTTWIDLIYARPGSGKSVLSNTLNLALCLAGGLQRLPRIAIIDIGPSSSGLISLLREALPLENRHWVAYHRLRMTVDYSINPFDTQLGCRYPTPQERSFLVNFLTLLTTPLGATKPYDAISDMAGLVIDELYKNLSDDEKPCPYTAGIEPLVDGILEEMGFIPDQLTTWWEVTDALFISGFPHEAMLAQRYAMPLLADAASICRTPTIEDLYGKITAPTGETLINAFARMISSAIREYPILSRVTRFDLGEARIVSLDLDEVAKSGGDAADRQTAVMYMLARYTLARHYYLSEDNLSDISSQYRDYHKQRIAELREDPKRIVFDEFHRTSKAKAVRDQVVVDMREGRKWNIQIALLSQSLDDFDEVMVEFATSIYIMDAGPAQSVEKSAKIFGLSPTATIALRTRVHGPREGGATFLAQFATKEGMNTQLLTLTLGPIELWAFSTTVEDANLRNRLYHQLGPVETRRVLARLFPNGTIKKLVEKRLANLKEEQGLITEDSRLGLVDQIAEEIIDAYTKNPQLQSLPI
ncbi:Dot/Icm secretion system protein IcmB [Candidatus Rickettsiella viridis]|uniref:Dot/Icm secretion system protein IcmB n=1 Tax=Candidatus Rickettsiella viridis TaxID=676208 RepID=A0A2Z5UUF6_9COXI|nr:type IV secretion protein IcmB [Candidatus Rickettsiella viridis]BBB15118.1 Dot/Icm secretion system protein IcmB [Candidatus Rickettsiella viridis]